MWDLMRFGSWEISMWKNGEITAGKFYQGKNNLVHVSSWKLQYDSFTIWSPIQLLKLIICISVMEIKLKKWYLWPDIDTLAPHFFLIFQPNSLLSQKKNYFWLKIKFSFLLNRTEMRKKKELYFRFLFLSKK